jgi:hypothetical protein
MNGIVRCVLAGCLLFGLLRSEYAVAAEDAHHHHHHHQHHGMSLDDQGMTMNGNTDQLPQDCEAVSTDVSLTIRASVKYAADFPGTVFGLSERVYQVPRCARVTVTFINEDQIRHQWMVHGLPRYLYPAGMFHLEAAGGTQRTGTFIVPGDDKTYLVHCDMAQHMEKGMKGQLKVGEGDGDLWAIPGVSGSFVSERYPK